MGLGNNAPVTASHAVMILILALTVTRLMRLTGRSRERLGIGQRWVFPSAVCMVLFALIVERFYYIAARALIGHGVDLWAAAPAPAVLSAVVALSVYWITPAYFGALGLSGRALRIRCSLELGGLVVLWIALEEWLR